MIRPTRLSLVAAALTATIAGASPALAGDAAQLRFISDVQTKAGWNGVEVSRVIRSADALTIIGVDRNGRQVTIAASCADRHIACPAPVTSAPVSTVVVAN